MGEIMVSFIVVAKEKQKREEYVKAYAKKHAIDHFDITIIEKDITAKPQTQSIGIEVVKQIHKKVFFKPLKSKNKLVIIEDAHLLTPEAQNALLKVLEEPPAHTFIFLGTETKEVLLPTILSRCQLIVLEEEPQQLSETRREELNDFIQKLPELSIPERLKRAEQLAKEKDKAVSFIQNLILLLREHLLQTTSLETVETIKHLQALHTLLTTTNVNPRFALEQTLLNL
jgi:DNA polymerase III gamma/tau subunit